MTNIATSLYFSDEFEGDDILTSIDQYRLILKGSTKIFTLNFNPSFFEQIDLFEIAIKKSFNKILLSKNEEEDMKYILKSFNTQSIFTIQTCNLSEHRNVYTVLQDNANLFIIHDHLSECHMLCGYEELLMRATSLISSPQVSVVNLMLSSHSLTMQPLPPHFFNQPISVTAHTLSERMGDWCLLAVAHADAMLLVWRFYVGKKDFRLDCMMEVGVCKKIKMLECSGNLCLCVSLEDGRVVLLCMETDDHTTKHTNTFVLWSQSDLLAVKHILHHPQTDRLLLSKNNNIISFNHFSTHQFDPVIIPFPCKYHITSIVVMTEGYMLTTYDGMVYKFSIQDNKQTKIETVSLQWNTAEWNIAGACVSHQQHFLICLLTPTNYFCTRKNKQPYIVNYIRLRGMTDICEAIVRHTQGPLTDIYQLLCSLKADAREDELWSMVDELGCIHSLSLTSLKTLRFLLCLLGVKSKQNEEQKEEMNVKMKEVEKMILHKHFSNKLLNSCIHHDLFSTIEKLSYRLIEAFLRHEQLNGSHETCPVCNYDIIEDGHGKVLCVRGHSIARCSQSLLLLTHLKHRVCSLCRVSAINISNRKERGLMNVLLSDSCSYCDALLSHI